jgi:hypothetical protein
MSAAITPGCDPSPILESSEGVLDAVALALECFVVGERSLSASGRRDAGRDPVLDECVHPAQKLCLFVTVAG